MNEKVTAVLLSAVLASDAWADQVRVMLQIIEVPHLELTKWMTGGKLSNVELHERAVTLVSTGTAEVMETNVLTARSGERSVMESYAEMISPAIYAGGGMCGMATMANLPPLEPVKPVEPKEAEYHRYKRAFDRAFSGFETRHIGGSLEIEPTIGNEGRVIDLRLHMETENREGLTTWSKFVDEWGDASVRTPNYRSQSIVGALTLAPGKFELFSILTPKPAEVPAVPTRLLVFVRCDVLPGPK
jgi:hypothetical protein